MTSQIGLAFLAGLLSTLSPCVLPLLPIVLGAAASEHRLGPVALAGGLALSFVAIGLFVATVGFGLGLSSDLFRDVSAALMIAFGVGMISATVAARIATAGGFIGDFFDQKFGSAARTGVGGQFGTGILLGAVWSPCVGPTLGAASLLASQGKNCRCGQYDGRIRVGSCIASGAARDGFTGGSTRSEGETCADRPNRKTAARHCLCRDRAFDPYRLGPSA